MHCFTDYDLGRTNSEQCIPWVSSSRGEAQHPCRLGPWGACCWLAGWMSPRVEVGCGILLFDSLVHRGVPAEAGGPSGPGAAD